MFNKFLLGMICVSSMMHAASSKPKKESSTQAYEQAFNQGYSLQKQSDYAGAIEKYSEAISLNSNYAEAYNNRAYCYKMMAKNYLKLSGQSYEKALKIKPNFPEALEYQGTYYLMNGQIKNAYNNYLFLLKLDEQEAKELKNDLDPILDEAKEVLAQMGKK